MDVEWTVTQPAPGRAERVPTGSDHESYRRRLALLLRRGSGYTEVSRVDSAYPVLTLSINEGLTVVHRFDDDDTCLLLRATATCIPTKRTSSRFWMTPRYSRPSSSRRQLAASMF